MRSETKNSLERIFHQLAGHPFLSITVMCILLFFFGFCAKENMTTFSYVYAGVVCAIIYGLLLIIGKLCRSGKESLIVFVTALVFTAGGLFLMRSFDNSPALLLWLSLFLLAIFCALMWMTDTLSDRNFIILLVMAGIMLRFMYDLYTGYRDRQHDVGYFNWTWGHANYIEHWYKNGLTLPDANQIRIWQYYHPPFHHWLMAILLRILTNAGMEYIKACEALQILPLLYSSLIMGVSYRIFRYVKLRGLPLVITMAIICFHPTFVLMGGFFNNDILCTLFMMLSIYAALRWYQQPTLRRIIPVALCVGLGMMTKLSAWMVAPAIAIMFLYVFVKNIKSWLRFIGQFAVFGVISVPLGLWWQVRDLIAFKMPLTYVPYLNEDAPQYCGDMSVTKRLFDFGNGQLSFVYDAFTDPNFGAPYDEYNPTVALMKTSLFGEGQNAISDIHFPQIAKTGPILFWIGVILALICFVSFFAMMLSKKSGLDGFHRVFFAVFALTMLGSYYLYAFQFPFTCSMNIRFCVPLIPMFAMGLGLMLRRLSGDSLPQKIFRYSVYALTAAFAVMICVVYSQVSFPKIG